MSPWQFAAAVIGWNAVHGSSENQTPAMSAARFREMVETYGDR